MKTIGKVNLQQKRAVIYCRVSSKKQSNEASGLDSQEFRCRQYAVDQGYSVEAVFPDDVSGGGDFMNRTGMVALLRYLDRQTGKDYVVIFDDLKRFARDTEFHIRLRRELQLRNASVECLNFRFEDTPEGKFVETVFAAQGQLEREQNARQVKQKMKARVEQGFWVFRAPVGYVYAKSPRGGKELIRDEPLASIVQEALEGYATGRFASQTEVKRFLESQPLFPKDLPSGELRHQTVVRLVEKPVYAGYVSVPEWGVSLRKGQHEPLISFEVFQRIVQRMNEGTYAPMRKDIKEDFPLRGAVTCAGCSTPLTAGWSKGKYKKYPYYFCRSRGCGEYGKAIARGKIESEFEGLLSHLQPAPALVHIATAMFRDFWNHQIERTTERSATLKETMLDAERKIEELVERIVETSNPRVIAAYERRIDELEREKLLLQEKASPAAQPRGTFDELFELAIGFLSNPYKIWGSGRLDLQRTVLKLVFSEHLAYDRKQGFRTPKTTLPFKVLGGFSGSESEMVLPQRFELWTSPLPRECSTPELRQHLAQDGGRPRRRAYMPDRPGRRKAVFADAASRHDAVRQNMGEPVTDEDRDTASERPKVDSESRKGGDKEPTAAERRAQALRDNLRRRKAQSRARSAARDGEAPPET